MATDSMTTGAHVAFTATVNGAPFPIRGKLRNWTVKEDKDQIAEKVVGQQGQYLAHEFVGNSGDFELITEDPTVDDLIDAIRAAELANAPAVINFTKQVNHRLGGRTHLYRNVKLAFSETGRRGEAYVYTVNLTNGTPRERIA